MSSRVILSAVTQELETLTDEERAALRAGRFHSAPPPPPDRRSRLAHPGGALATNKAAALAKFLKRKLEEDGAATLDPALVERAVENAKATVCSGTSAVAVAKVRHVESFSDTDEDYDQEFKSKMVKQGSGTGESPIKKRKKKKKKKKGKTLDKSLNVDQTRSKKAKASKQRKKKSRL